MNNKLAQKPVQNLTAWKKRLTPLIMPVDRETKNHALSKINTRSANANNIAQILKRDPALCLLLFNCANRSLFASGNESHDLSHVISLLGFPKVETLIRQSTELDDSFPYVTEYRQQLCISIHAAHQAESWTTINRHWPQGELYWASLFHCSPLWALWYHSGDTMMQYQQTRANRQGASHSTIEQELFGTPLPALCASLGKEWFLPSQSQQGWQDSLSNTAKQWVTLGRRQMTKLIPAASLKQICASSAFAINLANRLSEEAEWDWMSKRCLRLQRILATTLSSTVDQAIALTHSNCALASAQQTLSNTLPSAVQLLNHYKKYEYCEVIKSYLKEENILLITNNTKSMKSEITKSTVTSTSATTSKSVQNELTNQLLTLDEAIIQLTHQPTKCKSLHDVMNLTVTTLCQNTEIERACVSLLNIKTKEIRTFYTSGCKDSASLENYSYILQKGDLFNKLLQKAVCLWLNDSNRSKIWPLLPESFQQVCTVNEFFMMSLFANERPIALLYADRGLSHGTMNEQQYKQFRRISQAVCKCLAQLRNTTSTAVI